MENTKWVYFQFRKNHGYPIYTRSKSDELSSKFNHVMTEMGFSQLNDQDAKKIPLQKPHTRILTIQTASSRLQQQIAGSDLLDKYGHETLSYQAEMPVYCYRKVGIMGVPLQKTLWELALHPELSQTEHMVGLRVILVRFLSQALSPLGVISYWGTVKDNNVVIMKQSQSFGEAVIIDVSRKIIFSNGGEMKLVPGLKIIRKDKEFSHSHPMPREEMISFLSVSTCLLSFSGISHYMRRAIYELSANATATYAFSENINESRVG